LIGFGESGGNRALYVAERHLVARFAERERKDTKIFADLQIKMHIFAHSPYKYAQFSPKTHFFSRNICI
jgi:hypothetical protein